jgi:hypothetical protein
MEARMHHWPNLFIAGAPRCGTSSLHSYLQGIPGIFMSRIKEPNYFSRVVIGDRHPMVKAIRNQARYLRLFDGAGDAKVIGEATPFYLEDPEAPGLIRDKVPDAKVILSLRDPVERLFSHYHMMRNNRHSMGSFMQEIERGLAHQGERDMAVLAPTTGLYSRQVARYLRVFGEERVHVLILEEWARDVPRALTHILKFLGIEHDCGEFTEPPQRRYAEARGPVVRYLFGNRTISRASEAMIPYRLRKIVRNAFLMKRMPKPEIDDEARNFLVQYYREDVRRLELLLGRRLPWHNFRPRGGVHH